MPENTQSFRKDETDSPDHFIKKMKKTMSKKRKNNFKNIEELKNIYEENDDGFKQGEIDEAFDELEESLQNMLKPYTKNEKKQKKTYEDKEKEEDLVEGFSNNFTESSERIYKPEYEFDKVRRKKYSELEKKAKSGKLNTTQLKQLLNTGQITQSQYNKLFGFFLDFRGFNWKNNQIPQKKERCSKWNKNCGGSGSNILEQIKQYLGNFKQFMGLYMKTLTYISTQVYKSTDGKIDGKQSKNAADVSVIVNVLHYLIMIPLAVYFSQNWFYVMFYRDETKQPVSYDFSDKVKGMLKGLLKTLFKHHVQPVILLDSCLRKYIPAGYYALSGILQHVSFAPISVLGKILTNPIFVFISLVLIILSVSCTFSEKIMQTLVSFIADAKIPFQSYLHSIVAYDWIVGVASAGPIGSLMSFMQMLISPITSGLTFLFEVVFSHLTVRFGGIFVLLYLYAVSYFGLAIFSNGNAVGAMNQINKAFEASINSDNNKCPQGEWEKFILKILNTIYKYLMPLLYIIVLLYSTILIFVKMKSASSKIILGSTTFMIIVIIVMFIYVMAFQGGTSINKSDIDI